VRHVANPVGAQPPLGELEGDPLRSGITTRRVRRLGGPIALVALVALTLACGGDEPNTAAADSSAGTSSGGPDSEPIRVGTILDLTGNLSSYGEQYMLGSRLAVDAINENGGVLGRRLELVVEDAQSDIANYTVSAQKMAADSRIVVVQGGVTSASRAAITPIFKEANKLYFYNSLYEGGACDKNTFVVGETPSQQFGPLLQWAVDEGLKRWYVLAANYNYGQISSQWVDLLAHELGAEIVGGPTFFDLTVDNFSDQIPKIQSSGADMVLSLLVGDAHLNFYKQWAAAGLNKTTTLVSPAFGYGNEHVPLGSASEGIIVAYKYFEELDTQTNRDFVKRWRASGNNDYITSGAVSNYIGWHLWAEAVNKIGTLDREAVIAELEDGVTFDGPGGVVVMNGGSHHVSLSLYIARANGNGGFEIISDPITDVPPVFENEKCDLVGKPDIFEQFTP
jgi:urea transport system substrate-binding protein